jgi:hypothetical protein
MKAASDPISIKQTISCKTIPNNRTVNPETSVQHYTEKLDKQKGTSSPEDSESKFWHEIFSLNN